MPCWERKPNWRQYFLECLIKELFCVKKLCLSCFLLYLRRFQSMHYCVAWIALNFHVHVEFRSISKLRGYYLLLFHFRLYYTHYNLLFAIIFSIISIISFTYFGLLYPIISNSRFWLLFLLFQLYYFNYFYRYILYLL